MDIMSLLSGLTCIILFIYLIFQKLRNPEKYKGKKYNFYQWMIILLIISAGFFIKGVYT